MAGRGAGLGVVAALLMALGGCGDDPPEAAQQGAQMRGTAKLATMSKRATSAELPKPVASPSRVSLAPPAPVAAPALAASYPPRDECAKLPGFAAFREALFAAVAKRDAAALARLADPAVNLDFGGGSGPDELRKRLEGNPALWGELAALADLGCAADGGVATLPWIFSRMPDSVDAFQTLLVTGSGVPLRVKPAADARELAKLDWALIEAVGPPDSAAALREVTSGPKSEGVRGFVESAKLRSLLDYRLIADRQDGEWKVTAFVAGD